MANHFVVRFFGFLTGLSLVLGDVNMVTRSEWNAKKPANALPLLNLPVDRVIIAHTALNTCDTKEACSEEVKSIQNFHVSERNMDDIAYNYLIGNDGSVYEGRGADSQSAVVRGYNAGSQTIAFIGDFTDVLPSAKALGAAKELLVTLVGTQKLKEDYKLYGHSQLKNTVSPGEPLLAEIKTWPNWSESV